MVAEQQASNGEASEQAEGATAGASADGATTVGTSKGEPRRSLVRRLLGGLLWLVLIAAVAAGAYWGWRQYGADTPASQQVPRDAAAEGARREAAAEIALLQEALRGLEGRLQVQDRVQGELRAQLQSLRRELEEVATARAAGPDRDLLVVLEVEELLRLAAQRLWVSRSPVGVLPLLVRSDRLLAELGDPGLQPVRAALATEIAALKLIEVPDVEGDYLRIGALQEVIATLRVAPRPESADSDAGSGAQPPAADGFWSRLLANAGAALRRFASEHVRVRTLDQPPAGLLTEAEEARLRQHLHLLLSQAQLALLDRQPQIYRAALGEALRLLADQFDTDSRATVVSAELAELRDRDIAPQLPDLGTARERLREYQQRHPGPAAERVEP